MYHLLSDSSQLWKLSGGILKSKKNISIFDKEWSFTSKRHLFNIQNNLDKTKVLGITSDDKVIEEELMDGKHEQLWRKGKPDTDGYFSLEISKSRKLLTAKSSSNVEVLGNQVKLAQFKKHAFNDLNTHIRRNLAEYLKNKTKLLSR